MTNLTAAEREIEQRWQAWSTLALIPKHLNGNDVPTLLHTISELRRRIATLQPESTGKK